MAKENGYAQVRLPSGEVRLIKLNCTATIGVVSNGDHPMFLSVRQVKSVIWV